VPDALYEQGWANYKLGNTDEAVKLYEQVIAKTGREVAARAQYMVGGIQFEQNDHAEAVKSYFKVIYGYSFPEWRANAMFDAAQCFGVLKKPGQAAKMFQQFIDEYPEHKNVEVAKTRLEELK
jgi:TolA-binding protein